MFMLVVGVFRLDGLFAAPRQDSRRRRPVSGMEKDGLPMLTDPDGRTWRSNGPRN